MRPDELIIRYYDGKLTHSEKEELQSWLDASEGNRQLFEKMADPAYIKEKISRLLTLNKQAQWEKMLKVIEQDRAAGLAPVPKVKKMRAVRYVAAAAFIGLILAGGWFFWLKYHAPAKSSAAPALAKLVSVATYNTLSTPRAGQNQYLLPDGTKVWLNNASSLRYPSSFPGKTREVELSGEAYFEITADAASPFKVKVRNMTVDVLGTSLNIMAYKDDRTVKTTLLTGNANIILGGTTTILKPGNQAQLDSTGKLSVTADSNANTAIAWKNGLLHFDKADILTVMRMLSRWYNVDITYNDEGKTTHSQFVGDIPGNTKLSDVLYILQKNGVQLTIGDNNNIVNP